MWSYLLFASVFAAIFVGVVWYSCRVVRYSDRHLLERLIKKEAGICPHTALTTSNAPTALHFCKRTFLQTPKLARKFAIAPTLDAIAKAKDVVDGKKTRKDLLIGALKNSELKPFD